MAQVTVHINGKPYSVGCEDGQERHLVAHVLSGVEERRVAVGDPDAANLGGLLSLRREGRKCESDC